MNNDNPKNYTSIDLHKINFKQLFKKYVILIIGLFIMSYGVAMSVRSDLGTTPPSCIPYVLSFVFPLSLGTITILFDTLLVIIQILLLRSEFPRIQLLQILVNCIFGYFIDFALATTTWMIPTNYIEQWILCILSCVIIAMGVFLEVNSHALVLAGEGVALAIRAVTHRDFGKIKAGFDSLNVIIAAVLSLILFGTLNGVGLGTIFAGIAVGYMVKIYKEITVKIIDFKNRN